jgi:hypothetical protein
MKPQDVIVLLKMAISEESESATYARLAQQLKMSAAEVHAAVKRAAASGLLTIQNPRQRRVDREKLLRWLRESFATSFPAKYGPVALGLPTGIAAVNLPEIQAPADDLPFVWPSPDATTRGKTIKPLYRSAPQAAKLDRPLHECLALVDLLRIGVTREKDVAIRELERRIKPRNSALSRQMSSPFDINEQDIEEWAGRVDAPFILPELIRRIVLSLAPNSRPHFPAQKSTYHPGWDGDLLTERASIFADTPRSFWEIGDRQDAAKKIKEDFKKRNKHVDLDESVRRESTLVLLAAKPLTEKDRRALETQTKQDGDWRDVRIYDAIDIATWLSYEAAIPAAVWFREQMGQDVDGLETEKSLREKWEKDSRLPHSVVCVGREAEKERIISWLRAETPGPLRIRAETLQECVLFAISTIYSYQESRNDYGTEMVSSATSLSPEEADNWLSRIVVVRKEDAWSVLLSRLLVKPVSPLILIPMFPEFDGSLYKTEGHFVLIPSEPGRTDDKADIYLRTFLREELANFLFKTKFPENRAIAQQIALDSGGKLTSLVNHRKVDGIFLREPKWLRDYRSSEKSSIICGLLLAGAWDPRNDNDKKVLRELCDAKDHAIEYEINILLRQTSDPPLREQAYSQKWRSAADAWRLLAPWFTESILKRFQQTCTKVLARSSAKYNLPPEERFLAPLRGVTEPYSESLRLGLADSLAWLRINRPALARDDMRGNTDAIIYNSIKTILNGDWKRWATNDDILGTLAEANPETFLECLNQAIRDPKKNFAPLFQQHTKGAFSDFAPNGLLWALQTLAWYDSRYFSELIKLLLSLKKLDTSKTNNTPRPFSVLSELFHPLFRRSAASNEMRIASIKRLGKDEENIAWELVVKLSRLQHGGVILQNIRPRFADLDKLPQDFETYSPREVNDFFLTLGDLTEELLDKAPDRVRDILESNAASSLVLDCLSNHAAHFRDKPLEEVRDIQDTLRREMRFVSGDRGSDQERIRIQEIIAALDPDDPIIKNAWLFSFRARDNCSMSESFSRAAIDKELVNRRNEVIAAIPNDELSLDTIIKLARFAPNPEFVGETVAQSALADGIERDVWFGSLIARDADARFAAAFVRTRFDEKGWAWFEQCLREMVREGRSDVVLRLLQSAPNTADTRDWIEKELPSATDAYWKGAGYISEKEIRDSSDFRRCINNLIRSKKWGVALDLADRAIQYGSGYVDVGAVIELMEVIPQQSEEDASNSVELMAWNINNIFHWLNKHAGETYAGRIFSLALKFLGILDEDGRQPVSQRLSGEPALFVELLVSIYRPASETEDNATASAEEREENKKIAGIAYRIVDGWNGYPGDRAVSSAERDDELGRWCEEVLHLAAKKDRALIGQLNVGEVLARVPPHDDGIWPCLVARQFLQKGIEHIRDGLETARFNSREATMHLIDESGKQENEIAARYQADADRLRLEWPETAALLDKMAKEYESLAKRHIKRAERYDYK